MPFDPFTKNVNDLIPKVFCYTEDMEKIAKINRDVEHWQNIVGKEKVLEIKQIAMTTTNSYYDLLEKEVDNIIRRKKI
jgi:hypothetical protein